ncbi:MAG: PilZ domain-containing protein, partial [Elusimicrobia bacterium]|nr:PilZ domain-containing protein [Elusimicrobiota bacterium]
MSHKTDKPATERRRHARMPMVEGMIEPITVQFGPEADGRPAPAQNQPAILTNLSAGGMSLLMFLEPPHAKRLDMVLSIPGLEGVAISGKVVRVHQRGPTYNIGIAFTQISRKHQDQISRMAEDHGDCET